MVITDNNEEGFQLVKHNKRRQRKSQSKVNNSKREIVDTISVEEIFNEINTATEYFKQSPFYQTLLNELHKVLVILNFNGITQIICYGLGNFSENISSKYQLAALLCIKSIYSSKVCIFDPLFTKNEIECLLKLDLQVIENNEEGKRSINNHSTLVFMPHCSKQLTNNFLHTNWSPTIHNCILLGNSWSEIECHSTDALFKQTAYCIYKLKPYASEIKIRNNFQYPNVFSGTSLHIFTKEKLDTIPVDFWRIKSNLVDANDDPDFVTASNIDINKKLNKNESESFFAASVST